MGSIEYLIRIGEDVLELDGEGGAGVGVAHNRHDAVVVFVVPQFSYEMWVFLSN